MVLLGSSGTGKTHLACSLLRECGDTYRESVSVVEAIKQANSFGSTTTASAIINKLTKCNVLVIDEIGRVQSKEEAEALFRIMNAVYNENRMPYSVATSRTLKPFFDYVGSAFADRLSENGIVFEMHGESYRREARRV